MQQLNAFSSSNLHYIKGAIRWPFLMLIRVYQQFISPMLGQNCRFHPTCSCYTHQAIQRHGVIKGSWLGLKRISKCHPMHPGGIDHVPTIMGDDQHQAINESPSIKH